MQVVSSEYANHSPNTNNNTNTNVVLENSKPPTYSSTSPPTQPQAPITLLLDDLSMFHNRWNDHRRNDWTLVMYLLLYGADCMLILTSIIVFITSYRHKAGLIAGFLSFVVLLVGCILIGRMWRQYSYILVSKISYIYLYSYIYLCTVFVFLFYYILFMIVFILFILLILNYFLLLLYRIMIMTGSISNTYYIRIVNTVIHIG